MSVREWFTSKSPRLVAVTINDSDSTDAQRNEEIHQKAGAEKYMLQTVFVINVGKGRMVKIVNVTVVHPKTST